MYSVVSTGHHFYYQILFSVFALLLIFFFFKDRKEEGGFERFKVKEESSKGLRYQINFLFNFFLSVTKNIGSVVCFDVLTSVFLKIHVF